MNKEKEYSLIVIGGGMTGLSAALSFALNNNVEDNPVLLIEKEPKAGGFVTTYARGGFHFDTCQMIPNMEKIFSYLGVEADLKRFTGYYMRIFLARPKDGNAKIIDVPADPKEFEEMLVRKYPKDAKSVRRLLRHSRKMFDELKSLKLSPNVLDIIKMLFTTQSIVKNAGKTFLEYYKQFKIKSEEIWEIFSVFAEFSALPAKDVAALVPLSAMHSLLDGAFRPKGGFIDLPLAFKERYLSLKGEILFKTEVRDVIIEGDKVLGVVLADGSKVYAKNVISTIDPKILMGDMIGYEKLKSIDAKYGKKAESVKMSTSSLNVSIGLDENIDLAKYGLQGGYNVVTSGSESFNELFDLYEKGRDGFTDERFRFGLICPSLVTGSKPNLVVRVTPVSYAYWKGLFDQGREVYENEKARYADYFIDLIDRYVIKGIRKHIVVTDVSTPITYQRYSGTKEGSIYDMAPYVHNFGRTRLPMKTPIKGLYQPKFVHGVFGSVLGGMQAVDMILDGKIMQGRARY